MAERVWTVRDALEWTCTYLAGKGDEHPRRSAEWLLSAATGLSRVELYAFYDRPLSQAERAMYRGFVAERAQGMPLQYVTGEMPFRHLVLHVEPGVFIPRPETEVLVDAALEHLEKIPGPIVVDLCTGSGCIAVSIASEHGGAEVWATDMSETAVRVAAANASNARVEKRVHVLHGDLFDPLPDALAGRIDLVVSNPPYVPSAEIPSLPVEVLGFEPHSALDGGEDGLAVFRRIAQQAERWLAPGGGIAVELDSRYVGAAAEEMRRDFEDVAVRRDLAGRERVVYARKGRSVQR